MDNISIVEQSNGKYFVVLCSPKGYLVWHPSQDYVSETEITGIRPNLKEIFGRAVDNGDKPQISRVFNAIGFWINPKNRENVTWISLTN